MDHPLLITVCALAMLIPLLAGCDIQYRMLYYPSTSIPSEQALAGTGIRFWPASGKGYRGFIGGNIAGRAKGTFIVFHGNAGTAADREFYATALGNPGYRVILAEYPRYGGRNGKLGEAAFVKVAAETVRLAHERFGGPIFLLGESLGAGVACAVARVSPVPIAGIALITPWDTLRAAARHNFPYLPVRILLKDSYDNVANLSSFRGRIAIVAAGKDEFIPLRLTQNLYRSLPSPDKKMWMIEGAGHNDWPAQADPSFWKGIAEFTGGGEVSKQ
jgi:alpha-beta hydrolase superfamily lysophospholipase